MSESTTGPKTAWALDFPGRILLPLFIAILGATIGGVFYAATVIIAGHVIALAIFLGFVATFGVQLVFLYEFTISPLAELSRPNNAGVPLSTRLENAKASVVRSLALKVAQEGGIALSNEECRQKNLTLGKSYIIDAGSYRISKKSLDEVGGQKRTADFIDSIFDRTEDAKISRDRSLIIAMITPFLGFGFADWVSTGQVVGGFALTLGIFVWFFLFFVWELLVVPSIGSLVRWSRAIYELQRESDETLVDLLADMAEEV